MARQVVAARVEPRPPAEAEQVEAAVPQVLAQPSGAMAETLMFTLRGHTAAVAAAVAVSMAVAVELARSAPTLLQGQAVAEAIRVWWQLAVLALLPAQASVAVMVVLASITT